MKQLQDYTKKVSIEISGSVSSAAQVKAASIELANNTKVTAQEVEALKNTCALVRADLEAIVPASSR